MPAAATIEVVNGAVARVVSVPRAGLIAGRNGDEIRRVCGRLDDASILLLENSSVSKVHARFFWQGDDLIVEDGYLNEQRQQVPSRNHVHRHGQPLMRAQLGDGDELVLGDVVLRVAITGVGYGISKDELPETGSTLKPAPQQNAMQMSGGGSVMVERRAADMLPIVDTLFQAVDFQDLGRRIAEAVKAHLKPSRVAVLEIDPESDRLRVLGLAGADQPTFISRTVIDEALKRGVALHREESTTRPLVASMVKAGATSALAAVIRPRTDRMRILYLDTVASASGTTLHWTHALEAQLIAAHAAAAFDAIETQRQIAEQRLRFEHLRRFFAPNVVEHLLKNPDQAVTAQTLTATVLFADMSGYTALSERLADRLDELVALLNRWLEAASRAVFAYGGTLDKFMGDGVMAVFGAPFPMADGPMAAVRCALDMHEAIRQISTETGEDLGITVGINTGAIVAGNVGSKRRLEFTVLGDTVNVAARLQAKAERGQLLIGQATADALDARLVQIDSVGELAVKNRKQPVKAYRVTKLR